MSDDKPRDDKPKDGKSREGNEPAMIADTAASKSSPLASGTGGNAVSAHGVDPKLLEMLACPLTKMPLSWNPSTGELISRAARLAYPVRDGVPIMLPSEARTLDENELAR